MMEDKSKISDGYHTFEELYDHRHVLFLTLCLLHHEKAAWKWGLRRYGMVLLILRTS
jgi:hypothetical protein